MKIRIATFNVENLFARYNFREDRNEFSPTGFGINDLAFNLYNDTAKRITAKAIKKVKADIICLQEIENIAVLERFNSMFLARMKYKHARQDSTICSSSSSTSAPTDRGVWACSWACRYSTACVSPVNGGDPTMHS